MKKPDNPKERNLVKGAIRRVFSRSDLRSAALLKTRIEHSDPLRPRVTKWNWCTDCGLIEASYLFEIDHEIPIVPIEGSLEEMSWDAVVERVWCDLDNLKPKCTPCHSEKTKAENKERRALKKAGRK